MLLMNLYQKILQRSCLRDGYPERGTEPLSSKRVSPATAETTALAAQSSESQLIRYFESKAGLQIALLDRGWAAVLGSVTVNTVSSFCSGRSRTPFQQPPRYGAGRPACFFPATMNSHGLAMLTSGDARLGGFNSLVQLRRSLLQDTSDNSHALCCAIISTFEAAFATSCSKQEKIASC